MSREFPDSVANIFKDTYVLEMLQLPVPHSEKELKLKIAQNISSFLLEFGRDFAFMGDEYPLQVGNQDFAVDPIVLSQNFTMHGGHRAKDRKVQTGTFRAA